MYREKGFMNVDHFASLIESENIRHRKIWLWGWGEPLLHPKLSEFVAIAKRNENFVEIQSNGHANQNAYKRLLDQNLDILTISLDGLSKRTMQPLRGENASPERVQSLLLYLRELREKTAFNTKINVQCLATRFNETEIESIRDWVIDIAKADQFSLKTLCLGEIEQERAMRFLPQNHELSRYEFNEFGHAFLPSRMLNSCFFLSNVCVVLWDFTIVPCCYDYSGDYSFGNFLSHNSEKNDLIQSQAEFMNLFLQQKNPMCDLCLEQREKSLLVDE